MALDDVKNQAIREFELAYQGIFPPDVITRCAQWYRIRLDNVAEAAAAQEASTHQKGVLSAFEAGAQHEQQRILGIIESKLNNDPDNPALIAGLEYLRSLLK